MRGGGPLSHKQGVLIHKIELGRDLKIRLLLLITTYNNINNICFVRLR
jgi:hypothetical protein